MTSPEVQAEYDRMYAYYQAQGERYSFAELWPRATQARLELLNALQEVSDEAAGWSPGSDDWSIKEVALHILNNSRSTRGVVRALAAGRPGDTSGIEPPRQTTTASMDQLRAELRDDGIEWAAAILELPPRPPLTPTARHSMFGELHARAWYLFQRTHDLDHKGQIEQVKTAAGYPGREVR
ncbi:MAG: DinB family protein [Chloroflexi bacterium]|nr:DinB family protein [Chloroflexota bacterium]MDA1240814.1 DinB family protein [Chloroflexota bacterium]